MSSARIVISPPAAEGGESGYTATHYVDVYTNVSGASSNVEDRGATAWSNATSPASPTTFGTAAARAVAGNKVQCAPGVYDVTTIDSSYQPALSVAGSGSVGNPIIFFAQNPGAYNRGNSALWSELRGDYGDPSDIGAVIGCVSGNDYVVFDGFVIDQNNSTPRPSNGNVVCGATNTIGIEFRRWYCIGVEQPGSDNYPFFFIANATGMRWSDCYLEADGVIAAGEGDCITMYGSHAFMFENCEIHGMRIGAYAKGSNPTGERWNYGTYRKNLIDGVPYHGGLMVSEVEPGEYVDVYQNIFLQSSHGFRADYAGAGPSRVRVYNNVFIDPPLKAGASTGTGCMWFATATSTGWSFYNNICMNRSTITTRALVSAENMGTSPAAAFSFIDYNTYYNNGSTLYFGNNQDNIFPGDGMQLAAWRTYVDGETNSNDRNPLFVDAANGDFHLQGGSSELTAGNTGGPRGAYISGTEEIGLRANPTY